MRPGMPTLNERAARHPLVKLPNISAFDNIQKNQFTRIRGLLMGRGDGRKSGA